MTSPVGRNQLIEGAKQLSGGKLSDEAAKGQAANAAEVFGLLGRTLEENAPAELTGEKELPAADPSETKPKNPWAKFDTIHVYTPVRVAPYHYKPLRGMVHMTCLIADSELRAHYSEFPEKFHFYATPGILPR